MLVATDAKGDYAFLNLKGPAFDLSDRGVNGRAVRGRARRLRLHRARRLSLRRDRACDVAAARRAGRGGAERAADARGRAAGRRRISPRRRARPGRRRPYARRADQSGGARPAPGGCAPSPIRSARRSARPPSWSRTTCPTGWSSISPRRAAKSRRSAPAELTVDGRYLYGAPASALDLEGEVRSRPGQGAAGPRRLSVRPSDDEDESRPSGRRSKTCRRPTTRARRASRSRSTSCRRRASAGGQGDRAHGRGRRPRGRAQASRCRSSPTRNMIGVKPLFSGRSLGEGETATLRRGRWSRPTARC